jgi:predicted pyridoxine 5'-phosphate oxidase superfamily flavin-nucleotide-binding protein
MAILSEEAKSIIGSIPALVATSDASGRPNVSPKGSFRVLDDEHVMFADVNSPRTLANLLNNPQISAIVFDPATRHGCRIWGRAEVLMSGELFDSVNAGMSARNMAAKAVVRIAVDECLTF